MTDDAVEMLLDAIKALQDVFDTACAVENEDLADKVGHVIDDFCEELFDKMDMPKEKRNEAFDIITDEDTKYLDFLDVYELLTDLK